MAAVNFEHSWGDGVATLRYVQDIYKDSTENPFVHPNTAPYDDNINNVIRLGKRVCLRLFDYGGWGQNFTCKQVYVA